MRQDVEYLESIGLQRDAVANVEQIRGLVHDLNQKTAEIERLKSALQDARIALTFYRRWMDRQSSHAERYPFGIETEVRARELLETIPSVGETTS